MTVNPRQVRQLFVWQ